ncbi:MAG TPA: hypothetical protein VFZ53_22220, partial [Polyangiaceae bacterium]
MKQQGAGERAQLSAWRPFTSPLRMEHLHELRWYLERYAAWPYGGFRDEARRIESRMSAWGRGLFEQLLAPLPNSAELLAAPETRVIISVPLEDECTPRDQVAAFALP